MRKLFEKFFKKENKKAARLETQENEVFLKTAGEQLRILARKGLSIPVFTL